MSTTSHKAYGSAVSVLTTELNALGSGADSGASGTAFDNTSGLYLFGDFELILPATTSRTGFPRVTLFASYAPDGSNYTDVLSSIDDPLGAWILDAAVTARRRFIRDVNLPPSLIKFYVSNPMGVATAATGTIVKLYPHNVQTA